ncbi:MAG TPA: hypothetical protein P5514_04840 [Bacteroidales bacterium]|nr:hypothetical protein [Bacteroidales bacterium]HRX96248.1 hypothetical protein [Bacteroidales bacterium]
MKIPKNVLIIYGVIFFLIFVLFKTCDIAVTKSNLSGKYVYNQSKNTFDSLFINNNGTYTQKLYDKNKELIFENTDKWKFRDYTGVSFDNLLLNEDEQIYSERKYGNNDLMHCTFNKEKSFGKVRLCVNYDLELYYNKVE